MPQGSITPGNCTKFGTSKFFVADAGAPCGSGGGGVANPTALVGLTAVNGVATSAIRSDGAPALDQNISPTWTGTHTFNNTITVGGSTLASDNVTLANDASYLWFSVNRSAIDSPNDGEIRFSDHTGTRLATWAVDPDTFIIGGNDIAAPTAQMFNAVSVLDGTSNKAGVPLTVGGSKSTGSALGGAITFALSLPGASGTAQNPLTDIFIIAPSSGTIPAAMFAGADDTYALGSVNKRWAYIFASNTIYNSGNILVGAVTGVAAAKIHVKDASVSDLLLENTAAGGKKYQFNSYLDGKLYIGNVTSDDWFVINTKNFQGRSDGTIAFTSSTDPGGTVDIGLGRNAAGVIEINNGTLGTYRDLKLRTLNVTSDTTGAGSVLGFGTNSPASTLTGPYTWLKFISADGSTVWVPGYK